MTLPFTSRKKGNITAKVIATASLGGNEFARMIVTVNGIQIADFSVDAQYPDKKEYAFEFSAKPNFKNQIALTFPNDFWDPKNKDPNRRDRNLFVDSVEITLSPKGLSQSVKTTREHLLGKWNTEEIGDKEVKVSFQKWLPRIYRLPLEPSEFSRMYLYMKE